MVKNQELATAIDEILATLIEAVPEACTNLKENNKRNFKIILTDIKDALLTIMNVVKIETESEFKKIAICCENGLASLVALEKYEEIGKIELTLNKLEYELLPILRIGYIQFKYYALLEGDKNKEELFWKEQASELCKNYYLEESKKTGNYKYDVSIAVLAYNKLDYTKLCVEGILRNLPQNLRCELILLNHGSTDGTKQYFESIQPDKQIDIKTNSNGALVTYLIAEGKFLLYISNDVIIGKNTIEIMYECMKEDEKIAYAVPVTPNISNLQTDPKNEKMIYDSMSNFQEACVKYNKRDKRLEECRVRLLNPLAMFRMEHVVNSKETMAVEQAILKSGIHFGDDSFSLWFRRAGYKNVLLRDVYCHHFGSATVGTKSANYYLNGRNLFYSLYGVDAWEKGFCYSWQLFRHLICNKPNTEKILGINAGLGSNPLKIKEEIKLHTGNENVTLKNLTMEKRFLKDLSGVSDEAIYVSDWTKLNQHITEKYDYIMVCGGLDDYPKYGKELAFLYEHVKQNGVLIFQTVSIERALEVQNSYETTGTIVTSQECVFLKNEKNTQYFVCITKKD